MEVARNLPSINYKCLICQKDMSLPTSVCSDCFSKKEWEEGLIGKVICQCGQLYSLSANDRLGNIHIALDSDKLQPEKGCVVIRIGACRKCDPNFGYEIVCSEFFRITFN